MINSLNKQNETNIFQIVKNLARYSSGDNAQPFDFVVNLQEQKIDINHNQEIAKHELNPNNLTSVITYGMIIQMIEEQSLAFNFSYTAKSHFIVDGIFLDKVECWGTIRFAQFQQEIKNNFFNAVVTNRFPYIGDEVRFPVMSKNIIILNKITGNLLRDFLEIDSLLWSNSRVVRDIFHWIHLSKKKYDMAKTGFHYSELNLNYLEAFFLVLLKNKLILAVIPECLIRLFHKVKTKSVLNQTPHYICFTNKIEKIEDLISLGKEVFHVKFILAKEGIVTQPLTILTLPYLFEKNFNIKKIFDYDFENFQKKLKLKSKHNFDEVCWIFRAGYPKKFLPLSKRKNHVNLSEKS